MPVKEELIGKAETLLKEAHPSPDEIVLWQSVFEKASDGAVALFIDLMTEDANIFELLTENVKKKIAAGDDPAKIAELVDEEEQVLDEYLQS